MPPKGLGGAVPGFINQRRLKTCSGASAVTNAAWAGRRLPRAVCTPSAIRRARNLWYSPGVPLPIATQAECVCTAEISTCAGGIPVFCWISLRASMLTLRLRDSTSHTTSASRVLPSSSTRQRACSSSWTFVAMGRTKLPTISPPKKGVMLLAAAPARNTALSGDAARSCVLTRHPTAHKRKCFMMVSPKLRFMHLQITPLPVGQTRRKPRATQKPLQHTVIVRFRCSATWSEPGLLTIAFV